MLAIDITAILLSLMGMVSGWFNWWLDRKKHKEEVKALKVEIDQKELDLSTFFGKKFWELIGEPLEKEITELRTEVKQLRDAVREVNNCRFSRECPVRKRMQHEPGGN